MINDKRSSWHEFFRCLVTAAAHADLYDSGHPQVRHLVSKARTLLGSLVAGGNSAELLLLDEDIVIDKAPLPASLHTRRFSTALITSGVEHLRIMPDITERELLSLVLALSRRGRSDAPLQSSAHLVFGVIDLEDGRNKGSSWACREQVEFTNEGEIAEETARFAEICESARQHRPVSVIGLSEIVVRFIHAFEQELPPLGVLAPLRVADEYTFTHATNVCLLNLAQAKSLGVESTLLHDIGLAGLLHDVGKLFIPQDILQKPGKPTDQEWEILQQHPVNGARYLLESSGVPHLCVVTAFEHHMKFNLSGYPMVASRWRQHFASHITTISDIFDAICTKRSYRDPVQVKETARLIAGLKGTELHPQLTENFLGVIERNLAETA
ncbi:MAG: HD domain-containing protein [Syntrophotaleaceae bacterium]